MTTAIYPGSFDPITYGHLDIIERGSQVFDKLIIGVLVNHSKSPLFSTEERVQMIKKVTSHLPNVEVVSFGGLLVEFCKMNDINVILRGIRAVSDFEYELMMAQTNKELHKEIETVFFATNSKYSFVSSSSVRELAFFGAAIDQFVPALIEEQIHDKYKEKYENK